MNLEQNKFLKFLINPSFMKFQKNKEEKENEIMKRIKKIASLLLAMVMVFAMSVTAFATEGTNTPVETGNFTLTIKAHDKGDVEGYVYTAYQIFKGDVHQVGDVRTLSNIEWGDNVNTTSEKFVEYFGTKSAEEVAKSITGENATENVKDTDAAKNFAARIAECLKGAGTDSQPVKNAAGDKVEKYTISPLTAGYYLVQNTKVPDYPEDSEGDDVANVYTRYIMEIVGDAIATPKSDVPTSDKKIVEIDENGEETEVDVNEAAIGDTVNYVIRGTLPSTFADFKTYYYMFNDTLSKGLTAPKAEDIKVEVVNGDRRVNVSEIFWRNVTTNATTHVSTIQVGVTDLKTVYNFVEGADKDLINANTVIEVHYSAVVNQEAEIGKKPNTNDVYLDFSNDSNHSEGGTTTPGEKPEKPGAVGQTPKKEVETYVTELSILKVDENGNPLAGVEFTLTGTNGERITLVKKEVFVLVNPGDSDFEDAEFWKLKNGSYTKAAPIEKHTEEDGTVVESNEDLYASITDKYKLTKTLEVTSEPADGKTTVKGTVDSKTGRVTFTGLGVGDYTLEETVTPAGYNTIDAINFSIKFNVATKKFSSTDPAIKLGNEAANTLETTIENKKGSLLPSTGGIGTTIFYVVGGILVIGAGILLVTKRRMKAQ